MSTWQRVCGRLVSDEEPTSDPAFEDEPPDDPSLEQPRLTDQATVQAEDRDDATVRVYAAGDPGKYSVLHSTAGSCPRHLRS